MRILIISPGKSHASEMRDAIAMYELRLRGHTQIDWEFPASGTLESESQAILKLCKPDDVVILLDEKGELLDSPSLASTLDTHLINGTKRLVFVIGGAYGVGEAVTERASRVLSLSKLVFPHMLVRLILAEQLYRAFSIRSGGKYHHT